MDQVILVDSNDQEIGVMDKIKAHRGAGKLHRAISVFLFDHDGNLLIQQRSEKKIVGAGQWANTCCGNVRPGENYRDCARRRLREELGIELAPSVDLDEVTTFEYQVRCNDEFSEHEMDRVFVGRFDGDVKPNPDEVSSYRWMKWEDYLSAIESADFVPWNTIMKEKGILGYARKTYENL